MSLLTRDLTAVERRLCEAATEGRLLDLSTGQANRYPPYGATWGVDRQIRAQLLYQLLSGRGQLDTTFGSPQAVRIQGAAVLEPLDLTLLTLRCPLELQNCYVDADLDLTKTTGPDLNFRGSFLNGAVGAGRLSVAHDLNFSRCICNHGITLLGAHIGGPLDCTDAQLTNPAGPALSADLLTVDGGLYLRGRFTATGTGPRGALRLLGAHIGQLEAIGATLTNQSGPALYADGLTVDGNLFLRSRFTTATGTGQDGAVRLLGAHIGGQLDCTGATLTNKTGPALLASGLTVDGNLTLANGFTATGHHESGAVRLLGAHIGGQLSCTGATLTNKTGPALLADGLTVDGSLFLRGGFTATGTGQDGAVRLSGAHIGGQLEATGATLTNKTGPILNLTAAAAGRLLFTPDVASGTKWSILLSGLTYEGIPEGASLEWWLTLLRNHTPEYAAQPWQQLAGVHRAAGHERDARRILIAQQDDRRRRLLLPQSGTRRRTRASLAAYRTYLGLLKLVVGYGYQTWRALIALLLILAAAAGLGLLAGHTHINNTQYVAGHTKATNTPGAPCSTVEQIGLGVDLGLPLIKTNVRARCDLDSTTSTGQWITAASWLLQALSWGAATLVIAGYTGVVRRT